MRKSCTVLATFRNSYDEHKAKIGSYFKNEEPKEWEFAADLVFARYSKFQERVETVKVCAL